MTKPSKLSKKLFVASVLAFLLFFAIYSIDKYFQNNNPPVPQSDNESSVGLPKQFPADFPILPDAEMLESWTAEGDEIDGYSAIWEIEENVESVSQYFKDNLQKKGWEIFMTGADEESGVIMSFTKESRDGFLAITKKDESKTIISVTLGLTKNENQ